MFDLKKLIMLDTETKPKRYKCVFVKTILGALFLVEVENDSILSTLVHDACDDDLSDYLDKRNYDKLVDSLGEAGLYSCDMIIWTISNNNHFDPTDYDIDYSVENVKKIDRE